MRTGEKHYIIIDYNLIALENLEYILESMEAMIMSTISINRVIPMKIYHIISCPDRVLLLMLHSLAILILYHTLQ